MSLLVTCKLLRLFVNTFTPDDVSRDNLMEPFQMHLSQKQKKNSQLLCAFFKCTLNFEHFQRKATLIAYVFPKLKSRKDVLR